MRSIIDASSLIVLARLDGLGLLDRALGGAVLTSDVEAEVVTAGRAKGYPDAAHVEAAIATSALIVIDPTPKERGQADALGRAATGLSRADCTTIVCARERGHSLLIEDQRARRVASAEGVHCIILQLLPFYGYVRRRLAYASAAEWTTKIGSAMHSNPVLLDALATAMAEIAHLRGDTERTRRRRQ